MDKFDVYVFVVQIFAFLLSLLANARPEPVMRTASLLVFAVCAIILAISGYRKTRKWIDVSEPERYAAFALNLLSIIMAGMVTMDVTMWMVWVAAFHGIAAGYFFNGHE